MLSTSRASGLGEDCFEIGSHDIGQPTYSSGSPERVNRTEARTSSVLECLDSDVDSNLVSVLEAISNRFRDPVDVALHTVDEMLLDAGRTSFTGESQDAKWKVENDWRMRLPIDREPGLRWFCVVSP